MANIIPYKLQIWKNLAKTTQYVDSLTTLAKSFYFNVDYMDEVCLCTLASSEYINPHDATNIILDVKNNGETKLSFDLCTQYYSVDSETYISNPYLDYIWADLHIKLWYNNEWYEFVITNIVSSYNTKSKKISVTCDSLFTTELGKLGYSLEFAEELENGIDTVYNLANVITANTTWQAIGPNDTEIILDPDAEPQLTEQLLSDKIQEFKQELLYRATVTLGINNLVGHSFFNDTVYTFEPGDVVYIFSSCLNEGTTTQYLLNLSDNEVTQYINEGKNIANKDMIYLTTSVNIPSSPNIDGLFIPYVVVGGANKPIYSDASLILQIKAKKYIRTQVNKYDGLTNLYVNTYTVINKAGLPDDWSVGDTIYKYEKIDYLTSKAIRNLWNNSNNFLSISGWDAICVNTLVNKNGDVYLTNFAEGTTNYPALGLSFRYDSSEGPHYYFNGGFSNNKNYLSDGIAKGDKFVFKLKVYASGTRLQSSTLKLSLINYTINSSNQYQLGNAVFECYDNSWFGGYEYSVINDNASPPGAAYEYDDEIGAYTPVTGSLQPAKTYYYRSGTFIYLIGTANQSVSNTDLFNSESKYGFFLTSTQLSSLSIMVEDLEVFRYQSRGTATNDEPLLPEDPPMDNSITRHYYYKPSPDYIYETLIQYHVTENLEYPTTSLAINYSADCLKIRTITASKSNRYNLLSTLCDNFECWMQLYTPHRDSGKTYYHYYNVYYQVPVLEILEINSHLSPAEFPSLYTEPFYILLNGVYTYADPESQHYFFLSEYEKSLLTPTAIVWYLNTVTTPATWTSILAKNMQSGVDYYAKRYGLDVNNPVYRKKVAYGPLKFILFKESIGSPRPYGFKYNFNTTDINRTIKSESLVTKMIVESSTNDACTNGYCSISDATTNYSGESYIYNFNHYINKGQINGTALTKKLNTLNNSLHKYNALYRSISTSYLAILSKLDTVTAAKDVYDAAYVSSAGELDTNKTSFLVLTGLTYEEFISSSLQLANYSDSVLNTYNNIKRLIPTARNYEILKNNFDSLYTLLSFKKTDYENLLQSLVASKNSLITSFENTYSEFIREGSWHSDDYYDPNVYYSDAVITVENSAYPKVTYDIKVINLENIDDFVNYKFRIGDRSWIEDPELFGYSDNLGTPLKKDVAITEIRYNLTDVKSTTILVATFKNEFLDLFTRLTAATQTIEYKEAEYDLAASAITSTGFNSVLLQKAFDENNIILGNSGELGVVIDASGIKLTSLNNSNNTIRLLGTGVFLSKDGGNSWTAGITADGLNTSCLTAGVLYTNNILIVDPSTGNAAFRWDEVGISAYGFKTDTGTLVRHVNEFEFTRFDRFGIYGYSGSSRFVPTTENDIIANKKIPFSLTWSGLNIKTSHTEYENGVAYEGGGIRISKTDDFSVLDGLNKTRIKIGVLEEAQEGSGTSRAKYGMKLYGYNSYGADPIPSLFMTDDGVLWLANQIYLGGINTTSAKARAGMTASPFNSWSYYPSQNNKPFYPTRGVTNTLNRILYVPETPSSTDSLVKAKLTAATVCYKKTDDYTASTLTANTFIYILNTYLTEKHDEIQFYILTDALAQLYSGSTIPVSVPSYFIPVAAWSDTKLGNYFIPLTSDNDELIYRNAITTTTISGQVYKAGFTLELYDDGTFRSPLFTISSAGNVFLSLEDGLTLYGPSFLAERYNSLTRLTIQDLGISIYSLETNSPSLRAEMAVTKDLDNNIAINPYIRFILSLGYVGLPNKLGLIKMFPNGMWIGNANLQDSLSYTRSRNNKGILFTFLDAREQLTNTVAYVVNGETESEIATGNTIAVFG